MSPLDLDLGVDLDIADDAPPGNPPVDTGTGFLIHSFQGTAPTGVTDVRSPAQARLLWPDEDALLAAVDGYFGAGGGVLLVSALATDEAAAVGRFTEQYGPGQLMAPEVVTAAPMAVLRDWAWANNKTYLAQGADGASQAANETLADGLVSPEGRNTLFEDSWITIPGIAPGSTRDVAGSVVLGGLIARSDRTTGNPNLAAAGNHTPGAGGQVDYALGIKNERSVTAQKAMAQKQISCFRTVGGHVRSYGFWTLADLVELPQWWDLSGSRTMMAIRQREGAVAEELMFGQVAADGAFLDRYKGALAGELAAFQRIGALFGSDQSPGYRVDVSASVNPVSNVAQGKISAVIVAKTSPFAAELSITLTRKAITDSVA